mgnify:CR=1 FL=1
MIGKFTLLAAISLCWAAGYIFIDDADGDIRPITATAGMTIVAAVFMLLVVPLVARRPLLQPLRARPWVPLIMAFSAIALPKLAVPETLTNDDDDVLTVTAYVAAALKPSVPLTAIGEPGVPEPGANVPPEMDVLPTVPVPASVPPAFTATPLAEVTSPFTLSVPPLTLIGPMKVLEPVSVQIELPTLLKVPKP